MKSIFTPKDVVNVVGISYRQLQYWDKTDFIKPSAVHLGKYRHYTFSELVQMKVAKLLRDHSMSIQKLRKVIESIKQMLPRIECPLTECSFLVQGDKVFVFNGDVVMDSSTTESFFRFDVATLRDEVNRIYPEEQTAAQTRSSVAS